MNEETGFDFTWHDFERAKREGIRRGFRQAVICLLVSLAEMVLVNICYMLK